MQEEEYAFLHRLFQYTAERFAVGHELGSIMLSPGFKLLALNAVGLVVDDNKSVHFLDASVHNTL